MKKFILFVEFYGILSFQINAQYKTSDVFEVNEITWYGLDFSNVRLIGAIGFKNPEKIKNYYFDVWNSLILAEAGKYNLAKFFQKESINNYLDIVKERNTLPDSDELVIEIEHSFGAEKVRQIISEYDSGNKDGIGLVFIVESLNKHEEKAFTWVTFFDIQSEQVLLTQRFDGKARGFGFRNYWAGAYHKIMKSAYKLMRISWDLSNN